MAYPAFVHAPQTRPAARWRRALSAYREALRERPFEAHTEHLIQEIAVAGLLSVVLLLGGLGPIAPARAADDDRAIRVQTASSPAAAATSTPITPPPLRLLAPALPLLEPAPPPPPPVRTPKTNRRADCWPVAGGNRLTQGYRDGHPAIDLGAAPGQAVRAAVAGLVTKAGWDDTAGWFVWLEGRDGLYTTYNHLSQISVERGDRVEACAKLGEIGSTGHSTGPHLHFEVWSGTPYNSRAYDPLSYLR